MKNNILPSVTLLTKNMIDDLPICDIHVHLPGVISPEIAWALGVKNKFISIKKNPHNTHNSSNGRQNLSDLDPNKNYLNIFKKNFYLNKYYNPKNIQFNIDEENFKSFDRIMATIQGHRYLLGGIKTKEDIMLVFYSYLEDCISQKIFYTELQQNIKIAYLIFPNDDKKNARKKLCLLFKLIINKFKIKGVNLRFIHCFNKTKMSNDLKNAYERSIEASDWLKETIKNAPGVFVGIESAGHEKDKSGWPIHLKRGYEKVIDLGLGCEAHGGEGIGSEHMLDVVKSLPISRLAHGFQMIENIGVIKFTRKKKITLVMMPVINLNLGLCIHIKKNKYHIYKPHDKVNGGKKINIKNIWQHPFFELFRKYKIKITLGSDNPNIGGIPLKKSIFILAGLDNQYKIQNTKPLKAEELAVLCKNSINSIFSNKNIKNKYNQMIVIWIKKYNLNESYIKNFYN